MFRLIELHAENGVPRLGAGPDGYASEHAALARCRAAPATYFGAGRFGSDGRLAEIVVDTACGVPGGCHRTAVVVHAHTFQRLCDTCAYGLDVHTMTELADRLGVPIRPAETAPARPGRPAAAGTCAPGHRIARELAGRVIDPRWRSALCDELARTPGAVNGLLIGVGALSYRDVLDLWPELCALGAELPAALHADLCRATARPMSPAGVAALRLGL